MKNNRFKLTGYLYPVMALVGAVFPVVWVSWASSPAHISPNEINAVTKSNQQATKWNSHSSDVVDSTQLSSNSPSQLEESSNASAEATALMHQVVEQLAGYQWIEAKIRSTTQNIFNAQVNGAGEYLQSGPGHKKRVFLSLHFESKVTPMSMVQTTDETESFLWTITKTPFVESANRVELAKVWEEIENSESQIVNPMSQLPLVGLPGMIAEVNRRYEFASVQETELYQQPVWVITGQLSRASLARIILDRSPELESKLSSMSLSELRNSIPHHIPHQIVIAVNQYDLFPLQIDFSRISTVAASAEKLGSGVEVSVPLVSLSFSDVHLNREIESKRFQHTLEVNGWKDDTQRYIASITGKKAETAEQ